MSEGKRIYCKRFPKEERTAPRIESEAPKDPLPMSELLRVSDLIQEIKKNSVYLFRPDKMGECQRFIDLAKQFSQDYRIDTEIEAYRFYVSVGMEFPCGVYVGEFRRRLSELVGLCDRIALFPSVTERRCFDLTLDYYTHDCYRLGEKAD